MPPPTLNYEEPVKDYRTLRVAGEVTFRLIGAGKSVF